MIIYIPGTIKQHNLAMSESMQHLLFICFKVLHHLKCLIDFNCSGYVSMRVFVQIQLAYNSMSEKGTNVLQV